MEYFFFYFRYDILLYIQHIQEFVSRTNEPTVLTWVPFHFGIPCNKKANSTTNITTFSPSSVKILDIKYYQNQSYGRTAGILD